MRQLMKLWSIALVAVVSAMPARSMADEINQIGRLQIVGPWAARASAGETAHLYMKIVNNGSDDLHVIKMTSPIAAKVGLALAEARGERVQLPSITVLAHDSMEFGMSQLFVTLEGLTRDLQVGEQFPLTFHMAPHGRITTTVTVGSPTGGRAS